MQQAQVKQTQPQNTLNLFGLPPNNPHVQQFNAQSNMVPQQPAFQLNQNPTVTTNVTPSSNSLFGPPQQYQQYSSPIPPVQQNQLFSNKNPMPVFGIPTPPSFSTAPSYSNRSANLFGQPQYNSFNQQ